MPRIAHCMSYAPASESNKSDVRQHPGFTISADDIGLTKHNTDTILETVDARVVTGVSMLANGEALEYAATACGARSGTVRVAVHLNLTEGPALSDAAAIPLLADERGHFKHSVLMLGLSYACSSARRRRDFRTQIRLELTRQWNIVRATLQQQGTDAVRADGHQHVHMLPFVFDEIVGLSGLVSIRIPDEPVHVVRRSEAAILRYLLPLLGMRLFANRNRRVADSRGILSNAAFVGFLFSGHMTADSAREGLVRAREQHAASVEVLFHPGSSQDGELASWNDSRADTAWHRSPRRIAERAVLLRDGFSASLERSFTSENSASYTSSIIRICRYFISGAASAATNLFFLYALTEWLQIWYLVSAVIGFIVSMIVSFILQKFWTFTDRVHGISTPAQLGGYLILDLVNLGLSTALLYVLVSICGIWYFLAGVITLLVFAVESYFVLNYLIFAPNKSERL